MTIEELQNLKNGDCVKLHGEIFRFTGQAEYDGNCKIISCICNNIKPSKLSSITITKNTISGNCCGHYTNCLDYVIKLSEKEVLEFELKEAQEQVEKEISNVNSIKAKLEELSKPKLKIGGLYRFKFSERCLIGVLRSIEDDTYTFVSSGFNNYSYSSKFPKSIENAEFKEITNPKYSHIGPTILEFMKLNPENFQ